jgi:hypothetical protein
MKILEESIFSKEEWEEWAKGEFSLFDNYVKRMNMSEEDAQRLRDKVSMKQPPLSIQNNFFKKNKKKP